MRRCCWALLLASALVLPAYAQETRGSILGTVRDAQGVVPGATVTIMNLDTRATQRLVTNDSGYFEAPLMQPGNYEVTAAMTGFKTLTQSGLVLAVGQQLSLTLRIEIGQINETVTVSAGTPLLDTSSVSSGQNFDSRMVEGLPMFSNMPIMLTRFAAGVNPSTNQSLVSQGFADGTTQAAGAALGGVGSNIYSIDGATNAGSGRRIAASPNSDMIQEMRIESSNFDASVGHGLGLQIAMVTRSGANQYRGTGNYQYWTNRFNELNPSQKLTFTPKGRELYETGRSHNMALTLGGPVMIPKLVNGRNKLFFFANYSYVNDFIPGKNQGSSTIPASEAQLNGDFSDLLRLPNPAQYQIYDPLTVRADPANPNRFIRSPFPNNIIPANRIVNPLFNLYKQMLPKPNQNLIENGATPSNNYYRGGEPDIPVSSLYAGRIDYNKSSNDRFFVRVSGNTFIEPVSDWTYEVPAFEGLHSIDRSRYNWAVIGNWTHVAGKTLIDSQVASNQFFQDDLLRRLHEYKPTDMGFPSYLDTFCAAQNDCMLPAITMGGYQGISQGTSSGDKTTNLQGTVNVTQVRNTHTLRGGVDVRLAQRQRGPGGNPSGQLSFTNEFTRQASDTSQLTPSNLGLSMAAFMLGIPSTSSATIQPTVNLRNHFVAAYGQDSWRTGNLTINFGLRFEWENGISEDDGAIVVDFDPNAKLAISDLAEAAYARAPIPQLPPSDFHVRGGSVYATDPGQNGKVWKPQAMWMPRVSAVYKLGEKTVLKGGYGLYYDTLNAADFTPNNQGFSSTTTATNSTNFGQTFLLGNPYAGELGFADPFPVRADGTRFDEPTGSSLGVDTIVGSGYTIQNQSHEHARQQRWRFGVQREVARNLSVEVAYDGSYSDRMDNINIREDYLPQQYWIPGSRNARDTATQALLTANVTNPYALSNFTPLRTTNAVLYQRMSANAFFTSTTVQRHRLLRPFSQINNLSYSNLPLGEVKVHSLQVNVNRRFSEGFTANAAVSFNSSRSNRTVEEYDRVPTLWLSDNASRPFRLSGGAVYELPFGPGKPMLSDGGWVAALAGGWQTGGTFEYQPGSLIQFNTNLFYYGNLDDIQKSKPEIALKSDGTLDPTKYWFNTDNFEKDPTKTPTSFQTRAFPFQIDGLRGTGLTYVNMNVVRNFKIGGRGTFQARVDVQNLLNYAAYNNPITDPSNTNFGKVTTAVASAGAMRFFNFVMRFTF
jgi:Carboxypeptidase regulatory-like domain